MQRGLQWRGASAIAIALMASLQVAACVPSGSVSPSETQQTEGLSVSEQPKSSDDAAASSPSPENAQAAAESVAVVAGRDRPAAEIWDLLQQESGYVVLLRHARAPGTGDPTAFRLEDCSTQRNLSAEGREQARKLGDAFRQRQVPIARVLSSQWCRSLDTARLMDLAPVEPFPMANSFFSDRSTESQQTAAMQDLILQHRGQPGVVVVVTHQVNITALTDIVPREGEMIVLKAASNDQLEVVGRL